ncbi:MAG TPA: hypothetical protein DCY42_03205 [Chloroflexi bacterium]|nr:hypothetical protein [Chloroflexota bacterium]
MKHLQYARLKIILLGILVLILAGCNLPETPDDVSQQTAAAQTVNAVVQEQATETPEAPVSTATQAADGAEPTSTTGEQGGASTPAATQEVSVTPTKEGQEIGEDKAEFIADVTIPDYSEFEGGDTITKTWRVRNIGTTTWSTDYTIEFEKGEKLGAPTQIKLPQSVKPNDFVDISVDFTVPNAVGEYSSYWILKNADGERVGVAEEGKYFTMFMIIKSVSDAGDGGTSGTGGIPGGAKITKATVSVDTPKYTGSCPAQLTFTYTVTTANQGNVDFNLKFGVISPSGYKFDAPPEYSVNFSGGYTVTYTYTLFSANSVNATVKVEAVGSNTYTSEPVNFSVKCN